MSFKEKWRVPAYSGLMTCLAFGLVAALGATQKPAPKENHKVHIVAWAKDAKLSRKLTEAEIRKIKAARKKEDKRPAIVFFFGGGWTSGTVKQFEPQAEYLASRGMVAGHRSGSRPRSVDSSSFSRRNWRTRWK